MADTRGDLAEARRELAELTEKHRLLLAELRKGRSDELVRQLKSSKQRLQQLQSLIAEKESEAAVSPAEGQPSLADMIRSSSPHAGSGAMTESDPDRWS